jgi:hypothetical protein
LGNSTTTAYRQHNIGWVAYTLIKTCAWDLLALQVYLDGELMKTYYGKESAPPGSYNVPGALGRQVASTKESAPGIKIGTSLRALDYTVSSRLSLK